MAAVSPGVIQGLEFTHVLLWAKLGRGDQGRWSTPGVSRHRQVAATLAHYEAFILHGNTCSIVAPSTIGLPLCDWLASSITQHNNQVLNKCSQIKRFNRLLGCISSQKENNLQDIFFYLSRWNLNFFKNDFNETQNTFGLHSIVVQRPIKVF